MRSKGSKAIIRRSKVSDRRASAGQVDIPVDHASLVGAIITLRGVVQGVGFRPYVHRLARECGLAGSVRNFSGGVVIEVEGPPDRVEEFDRRVSREVPPLAHVVEKRRETSRPRGRRTFTVAQSTQEKEQFVLVSPDIATCPSCLAELMDPVDRRHRYPFVNCTDCGPRFTIIEDVPYDRPLTTMRDFTMCRRCRGEYEDIDHRRYHAQPNACPDCGPQLFFRDGRGEKARGESALQKAIARLKLGQIVAVRGLGGFHLCCNAADDQAVKKLRRRKNRPVKPLAIMSPDLETVRALCHLSDVEEEQLSSPARPIVVLKRRRGAAVSPQVAPGNDTLGVMLPYAPVQALLLSGGLKAMVATSANLIDQPLISDNGQACEQLAGIADAFLFHDRQIHTRCDDSIVRLIGGQPAFLRRARGYVPMPLPLPFAGPAVLACGPELKNTFCLTREDWAFLGQHIGDLKNLETYEFFRQMVGHFEYLFRIRPQVLAHDLHPQYLSTRYALERSAAAHPAIPMVAVQHHHAHVAACLADNGVQGAAIGVVFDGLGYGADGHIWGAEFLVADYGHYRRRGQLRYIPLPGGDAANREPWRMALSYLWAIQGDGAGPLAARLLHRAEGSLSGVLHMLSRGVNSPLASSMGRLFDAVSSLLGLCQENTYEGQAAVSLETAAQQAADPQTGYPWDIEERRGYLIADPRSVIRAVLVELDGGRPVAEIARRFHRSAAELALLCCRRIRQLDGLNRVALSGGVFQNKPLTEMTLELLRSDGFEVLTHRQVPANDGGVALGQAAVAAWIKGERGTCA